MSPIIGITTYGRHEHDLKSTHYDTLYPMPAAYADGVRRAGGVAVMLPPGQGLFPAVLDRIDGIIFSGGTDIDPARYGGNAAHPELGKIDAERDAAEIEGVRAALARPSLPILCICRGFQVLNVARGGSLVEHVPDLDRGDLHRSDFGHWTLHEAVIDPGSHLAAALGAVVSNGTSGHHQAIRTVGENLAVTAQAPDGVVEALEATDHPWCVGVQWHPEVTADRDPLQQRLFDELVRRAAAARSEDRSAAE